MRPTELIAETGPLWHTIIHRPAPLSFIARKSVEERIVRGSLLLDACNLRCAPWVSLADSMRAYLPYQLLTTDNKNSLTQFDYVERKRQKFNPFFEGTSKSVASCFKVEKWCV